VTLPERLRAGAKRPDVAPALFRLLAEAALSRAALDACGLPVALADATSARPSFSYVNQAFEAYFGYRAAEALGRPAAELLQLDAAAADPMFREGAAPIRLRSRRKDGAPLQFDLSVGAVRGSDGRVTHWVLAFSDRAAP
jgi:PAS domain S-box-containing protein